MGKYFMPFPGTQSAPIYFDGKLLNVLKKAKAKPQTVSFSSSSLLKLVLPPPYSLLLIKP
jgi:hypothetical protein